MLIEKICHQLSDSDVLVQNLEALGTALRDENIRKLPLVRDILPIVLRLFIKFPMDVLRVLINYTADNSNNRLQLLESTEAVSQFWNNALKVASLDDGISDLSSRFMILITQFVRATDDDKKQFLLRLKENGSIEWVWRFYKVCVATDLDLIDNAIEVLAVFVELHPQSAKQENIELIMNGLNSILSMAADEDSEDAILSHTQFLVNVTNVKDSQLLFPINDMISCISRIPAQLKNSLPMKKNLFAACGGIFSFPSFDNLTYMEFSVPIIESGSNPYATAAAAISLGNCVLDKESQVTFVKKLDSLSSLERIGQLVLHQTYSDVIQLQAFHFFNNCMNERLALYLLQDEHKFALYKTTKMMVDNYKYYEQIGQIYLRFLSKLVTLGLINNTKNNLALFSETWDYLSNLEEYCEVKMLILQAAYLSHDCQLTKELTSMLFSELLKLKPTGLDAQELLTKLKTLAIVFQNVDIKGIQEIYCESDFQDEFLHRMEKFLKQILLILEETTSEEYNAKLIQAAVTNNCRFVAATVIEKLKILEVKFPSIATIEEVCLQIIREPHDRGGHSSNAGAAN